MISRVEPKSPPGVFMSTISASAPFADAAAAARATNSACGFDTAPSNLNAHTRYSFPAGFPPPRCQREPL